MRLRDISRVLAKQTDAIVKRVIYRSRGKLSSECSYVHHLDLADREQCAIRRPLIANGRDTRLDFVYPKK